MCIRDRDKALVNSLARESATTGLRALAGRFEEFLAANVSGEILTVDPALLGDEGKRALQDIRIGEAARQIAWLAGYYDRQASIDGSLLAGRLAEGIAGLDERVDMERVWQDLRQHLDEETVEVLPPQAVDRMLALVRGHWAMRPGPDVRPRPLPRLPRGASTRRRCRPTSSCSRPPPRDGRPPTSWPPPRPRGCAGMPRGRLPAGGEVRGIPGELRCPGNGRRGRCAG